jgi:hypothetical protein
MSTSVIEQEKLGTTDVPDDAAHIVMDPDRERDNPQVYIMEARIEGIPVEALCGYIFTPEKDPLKKPVCSKCLEIFQHDPKGHGDRDIDKLKDEI